MDTKFLADYTISELKELLGELPAYRAQQIFSWVSKGAAYDEMSNLPKQLIEKLSAQFVDLPLGIEAELKSRDGSVKLLYRLNDGNIIEGIFMPHSYGNTLCVSTQVGCKMRCKFCASGLNGLIRNLSAGEIYAQVTAAGRRFFDADSRAISNIVLMGSGEPLDNYDNTAKFIRLVTDKSGLGLSQRGISLSTCGLPDGIVRLADDGFSVTLSISLHATTDEIRRTIMPIAVKHTIKEILDAARYYFNKSGRRVIVEYAMISGVNVSLDDAKRLRELLHGIAAHINLIPLNYIKESPLKPATKKETGSFVRALEQKGLSATIRRSAGSDTDGACGQLRRKFVGDLDSKNSPE